MSCENCKKLEQKIATMKEVFGLALDSVMKEKAGMESAIQHVLSTLAMGLPVGGTDKDMLVNALPKEKGKKSCKS